MEKSKALQTKAKRIQHHKTSLTTNAKGTSLGRGEKRPQLESRKSQMGKLISQSKHEKVIVRNHQCINMISKPATMR